MKLFVSKNDTIKVTIYAFEHKSVANCVIKQSDIPEDVKDFQTLEFSFRTPNYSDSNNVLRNSQNRNDLNQLDIAGFQDTLLRSLIVEWNLKDESGKEIEVNTSNINSLLPVIARTACAALLEKVKL